MTDVWDEFPESSKNSMRTRKIMHLLFDKFEFAYLLNRKLLAMCQLLYECLLNQKLPTVCQQCVNCCTNVESIMNTHSALQPTSLHCSCRARQDQVSCFVALT